jgi:hypothetical protein
MDFEWTRPAGNAGTLVVHAAADSPAPTADSTVSPEAATAFAQERDKAGMLLRDMYEYLKANVGQHPALTPAISLLSSAVAEYRTEKAQDPFSGVRTAYNAIEAARRADPSIPEA